MPTNHTEIVIVGTARTPIGKFQGSLASIPAPQLGAFAIQAAVSRAGIPPDKIDEVLMGCVITAGLGQNPARQASIHAGIPISVGALTLNKVCGSGLKSITLAASMIRAGDAKILVAGGMENMNRGPYLLLQGRTGYRLGHNTLYDATIHDGLWCAFENQHMGHAAEFIAQAYHLTREELDAYAYESHRKAIAAIDSGAFREEIVPVEIPQHKGPSILFDTDECPRRDTSPEKLAALRPVFQPDGLITAGNAPGITDGAAAVVLMRRDQAEAEGIRPLARIIGYAQAAVEPKWIFTAPAHAIRTLLRRTRTSLADYDLIELNEAFAAQCLANGRDLADEGWDWDKVNIHGGAIALGHPIGCSGTRILVTLIHALRRHNLQRGIATLCLGGGEAIAIAIEAL